MDAYLSSFCEAAGTGGILAILSARPTLCPISLDLYSSRGHWSVVVVAEVMPRAHCQFYLEGFL